MDEGQPTAPTSHRALRVGISGSYGGLNLGDEAILQSIVTQLRSAGPVEITVFSRDAEHTLAHHGVERAVQSAQLSRHAATSEVERLDLFVLGGGGLLYDAHAHKYLREVALAHDRGVPVMLYAVGAGPLKDAGARTLVREQLTRVRALTVRDHRAQRVLEDAGVERDIVVTADPALLLSPEPLPPDALRCEGLDEEDRIVGMSVREPGPAAPDLDQGRYHELLANAADYLVDRLGAHVVFVPMERRVLDLQHCHAVIARMGRADRATVLSREYSPGQLLSLVGKFVFAVGMRLHFLLFAFLQRVPFVALPYASKVVGFVEDLGMPSTSLYATPGQLIARIDECWDRRRELRAHIESALPEMRARARESHRIALSLLSPSPRPVDVVASSDGTG